MKKRLPLFLLVIGFLNLNAQTTPTGNKKPETAILTFDSTSYHFPTTQEGTEIDLELHFKNTGKEVLIISECYTTCGCDVASGPREPIKPGGTGTVRYRLDTSNRSGPQSKSITIHYNGDQMIVVPIHGEIILPITAH